MDIEDVASSVRGVNDRVDVVLRNLQRQSITRNPSPDFVDTSSYSIKSKLKEVASNFATGEKGFCGDECCGGECGSGTCGEGVCGEDEGGLGFDFEDEDFKSDRSHDHDHDNHRHKTHGKRPPKEIKKKKGYDPDEEIYEDQDQDNELNHGVIRRVSAKEHSERKSVVGYDIPGSQIVYLKTYGCSHNFSDSEYMAGLLIEYGYGITEDFDKADIFILNSCTVKNPSEQHLSTLMKRAIATSKPVIVAGCVPQGDPNNTLWDDVSIIGVQQIHRVVEVVEESLKGNRVRFLKRTKNDMPVLDLPKVRRNRWIEIVPINVGCLNHCTYCKTKHARGHLASWTVDEICSRVAQVIKEGVTEIRLTSEDTGAYGHDIGTNISELLNAIVKTVESTCDSISPTRRDTVMLRIGMSNPPYILAHLDSLCTILNHPNVYAFLHVPVQSASDNILGLMRREYTQADFRHVVDTLRKNVPGMIVATDIICGFPGESEEDFQDTLGLVKEYKFPVLNISQFYPRPGTPAASMKQIDSKIKKERSRKITQVFESYQPFNHLVGTNQRVWITEQAYDGHHLVGHTKNYVQVLVDPSEAKVGQYADVEIVSAIKWSVTGKVVHSQMHKLSEPSQVSIQRETQISQRQPPPSTSGSHFEKLVMLFLISSLTAVFLSWFLKR